MKSVYILKILSFILSIISSSFIYNIFTILSIIILKNKLTKLYASAAIASTIGTTVKIALHSPAPFVGIVLFGGIVTLGHTGGTGLGDGDGVTTIGGDVLLGNIGNGLSLGEGIGDSGGTVGSGDGEATGGDATGGEATGGDATGGDATGGEATGGEATGGEATGGDFTGGEATGGEATGGEASGGDATGGEASGGEATGGDFTGGDFTGGEATGGDASGDVTGGEVNGIVGIFGILGMVRLKGKAFVNIPLLNSKSMHNPDLICFVYLLLIISLSS
jgi:hypothetical protein